MFCSQTNRNVLLVGESPVRRAPTATLASRLAAYGFNCVFSNGAESACTKTWISLLKKTEVLIVTTYYGPSAFLLRQMALAVSFGKLIIRYWNGTDVLNSIKDSFSRHGAQCLNRMVSLNIATAPHLVDELASIGIKAEFVPPVFDYSHVNSKITQETPPMALLIYLPTKRKEFYGFSLITQVVEANPNMRFVVVGDDSHSLSGYPNVVSLGWLENMDHVWNTVGGLLRITQHDSIPRMVLEALLCGKYVIFSWPLSGCWLAKDFYEVQEKIERFCNLTTINYQGIEAAQTILNPDPAQQFAEHIQGSISHVKVRDRLAGLKIAISITAKMKLQKYLLLGSA